MNSRTRPSSQRSFALFILLATMLVLAACNGAATSPASEAATTPAVTEAPTEAVAEAPVAAEIAATDATPAAASTGAITFQITPGNAEARFLIN